MPVPCGEERKKRVPKRDYLFCFLHFQFLLQLEVAEGLNVNGEAVLDVRVDDAGVGLVDVLGLDHLDRHDNLVLGAEVDDGLRVLDVANEGAEDLLAAEDDREGGEVEGLGGGADEAEGAVGLQEAEELCNVVLGGDGVDDAVEGAGVGLEVLGVGREDDALAALVDEGLHLRGRAGHGVHLGAHRLRDLDGEHAEAANADDANLGASLDAGADEGGVDGDAGAEDGGGDGELVVVELGDLDGKLGIDDNVGGVAAVGVLLDAVDELLGAVGANVGLLAVHLVLVVDARVAGEVAGGGVDAAGADHAANAVDLANLNVLDVLADGDGAAAHLVAGDVGAGEGGVPLAADVVDVAVADGGGEDLEVDIVVADGAALDAEGGEVLVGDDVLLADSVALERHDGRSVDGGWYYR